MQKIHTLYSTREKRRSLRSNMTEAERILWSCIKEKKLKYQFHRQHSIGHYIVDFYCPAKKLIIEIDGKYHEYTNEYDRNREKLLESLGFTILRFTNEQIKKSLVSALIQIENILFEL